MYANTSILSSIFYIITNYGDTSHLFQISLRVFGTFPTIWLVGFIAFKLFKTKTKSLLNMARKMLSCCKSCGKNNEEDNQILNQQIGDFNDLPDADRMLHPEQYMQ